MNNNFWRLFLFIFMLVFGAQATAQNPGNLPFQALITNTSDVPLTNTTFAGGTSLVIAILDTLNNCVVYQETVPTVTTDGKGMLSWAIGTGTTTYAPGSPGTLRGILTGPAFTTTGAGCLSGTTAAGSLLTVSPADIRAIQFSVDNGATWSTTTQVSLGSVPYAFNSDSLGNVPAANYVQTTSSYWTTLTSGASGDASSLHNHDTHNDGRYVQLGGSATLNNITAAGAVNSSSVNVETGTPTSSIIIGSTGSTGSTTMSLNFDSSNGGTNRASISAIDNQNALNFSTGGTLAMSISNTQQVSFASSVGLGGALGLWSIPNLTEATYLSVVPPEGTTWENSSNHVLRYYANGAAQTVVSVAAAPATGSVLNYNGGQWLGSSDFLYDNTNKIMTIDSATAPVGDALVIAQNPKASTAKSLLRLGPIDIAAGTSSGNGTYIGANSTTSNADFVNFQNNSVTVFNVTSTGAVTATSFSGNGAALTGVTATDNTKVLKTGDTMTGALINNTTSASPTAAVAVTQSGTGYAATFMGGYVGIGTTTPGGQLEVDSAAVATVPLVVKSPNATSADLSDWYVNGVLQYSLNNTGNPVTNTDLVEKSYYSAATANWGTNYVRKDGTTALTATWNVGAQPINNISTLSVGTATAPTGGVATFNGNVGIGTPNPSYPLHISGAFNPQLELQTTGSTYGPGMLLNAGGGRTWLLGSAGPSDGAGPGKFFIYDWTGNNTRMVIDPSGNVGIGITNPSYLLQLGADSAAKPGTSAWTIASDERLKDIRAPFTRSLDALDGLHTIYFKYKKDNPLGLPSDKEYVGIRAQEALKVIPEAVSKDEKGYYHVTNDSIIWTAINSIKELYHKVLGDEEQLANQARQIASKADKADVEAIKAENTKLKQENAQIKAYLCAKDPSAAFCK